MRVLAVTGLFPRSTQPTLGVFIRNRLRALQNLGVEVRVISPLPWVPPGPAPARYARVRATPAREELDGIRVEFPRYPMIPKIGTTWQSRGYARGLRRTFREVVSEFRPDLVDAHYLYPDCCGAGRVAEAHGLPYVCSARGSDVQVLGKDPALRPLIRHALTAASAVVSVSANLAKRMVELELFDGAIDVIPNGIDPNRFHPRPREEARSRLGLPVVGRRVVCVGHLVPTRCIDLLIRALAQPAAPADVVLHLIGDGLNRSTYEELARTLGIASRVVFEGSVDHDRIPDWFAASNGSIQLNRSAGSPNAVLESLACRTPVLASDIPAMQEAMANPDDGLRVALDEAQIACGIKALVEMPRPVGGVQTWDQVGRRVKTVFERVLARPAP